MDVIGFVKALEKQMTFYRSLGLDMLKESISLPGLALKFAFQDARDAKFHLFGPKHGHLHRMVKDNVVGGPSILFHRHHRAGETRIQHSNDTRTAPAQPGKLVGCVKGVDANA